MSHATEQKEPTPLPIIFDDKAKYRNRLLYRYASLLWRHTEHSKIVDILDNLYEQAYGDGLKANEKMHKTIDNA